jgi:hypothetical protein
MEVKARPVQTLRYGRSVLIGALCFLPIYILLATPLWPWLSVKNLERQVKHNISPAELQQWATNLLANNPGNYADFAGTNLPPGLQRVWGYDRGVRVFHWHGQDPEVAVFSMDKGGGPWLVVGAPSLPTPTNSNIVPWKPGIYFMRH